ncbi:MAG: hypothetical protein WC155_01790 [Candidatus Cloacimonadales bacterium]
MNKKTLALLFVIITLIACSPYAKLKKEDYTKALSPNLIKNGDFEIHQEKIGSTIPGWVFDISLNGKVAIDTTRSFTGKSSLRISQPIREIQLISEPFVTNFRNVYGVSITAKSVLKKVPVLLHFITFSETGKIISKYKTVIEIDTNWKTFKYVSDHLQQNSEFGRIFLTIPQTDSVILFDNISCNVIDAYQKN